MKKILILISIWLLVLLTIIYIFVFRFKLEVSFKPLEVMFNEPFNTNDFIIDANTEFINQEITLDRIGTHKVILNYKRGNKIYEYPIVFKVTDNTAPIILANDMKTAYVGEDTNLIKGVICVDDIDDDVICSIQGSYDLNEKGSYNLKYKAVNTSGLETYKDFILNVIDRPKDTYKPSTSKKVEFIDVYKKYKNDNTLIGIDVSRFQGDIDFNKVKEAGCEFVIIRLGWDVDTEVGLDYNYEKYIEDAYNAGLKIGLYFYTEAKTKEEVIKDVMFIKDNIKYNIDLPIAYDWEDFGDYNDYN